MLSTLYTAAPNGNGYGRRASSFSERAEELILNAMSLRLQGLQRYIGAGGADRRRDVYDEAGYPQSGTVTPQLYQDLYEREPLAAKVVELLPVASWQVQPTVYETEDGDVNTPFERAWDGLGGDLTPVGRPRSSRSPTPTPAPQPGKTNTPGDLASQVGWYQQEEGSPVWEALLRADVQSRIGRYGILVLGVDDGLPLSAPARGVEEVGSLPAGKDVAPPDDGVVGRTPYGFSVNAAETRGRRLRYLKSFPERYCPVSTYEMNFRSPRFGMPVTYLVTFNVGESRYGGGGADLGGTTGVSVTKAVHWTRVVHVCDVTCNYGSSDVYGGEAMRTVLNNILGVQKIVCAGPEMFWKAAFLTTWLVAQQGWEGNVLDEAVQGKIKDLVERMDNGLQRTATVQGLDPKTTAPGVTDPNPHVDAQIKQISLRLNIPKRILEGSERGELSSSQDEREWKNQVRARQRNYTTPRLIVPFVDRLILLGVLPEPSGYSVDWPDVSTATDAEKAQVLLQRTQAYASYVAQGVENVVPPAYYLTRFDDFTDDEARVILADAEKHQAEVQQKAMDDARAKIDAGLAPDPQAPPAPPEPVKSAKPPSGLKPGGTAVPHPNSPPGKKFPPVEGAPLPRSKPVPPTRNATTNATTNANPKGCNQYTGPNCSGRRGKDGRLLKDGGKKPKAEGEAKAKGTSRTPAARKAAPEPKAKAKGNVVGRVITKPTTPKAPAKARPTPKPTRQSKPAGKSGHGAAGGKHPLGKLTGVGAADRLGEMAQSEAHDPMRLRHDGPPRGLDLDKFGDRVHALLSAHKEKRTDSVPIEDVYASAGKEFDLSKHDFLRAVTALHDDRGNSGVVWRGYGKTPNELPDKHLAGVLNGRLHYELDLSSSPRRKK